MLRKVIFPIIFFTLFTSTFSQSSINDYKYVIVPNKYEFLDEADQYQLNSLTKFLFNKYNFHALLEDEEFPNELIGNSCLALKSNVLKESGMFKTKLKVELKNCKGEVIYTTRLGESREKKLKVAFNLALRESFTSFETLHYQYKSNAIILAYGNSVEDKETKKEIEQLKDEIKLLKEEKVELQIQAVEVKPIAVVVPITKTEKVKPPVAPKKSSSILYAQKINNGFQLVNSEPKVIYKIKNTGLPNVYLVEGKQAILYLLETEWVLEYYQNGNLKKEILKIKF